VSTDAHGRADNPWWREHLALWLSLLSATTVVVKVWDVAHGNTTTIAALVGQQGALTVVGQAFVVALPGIAAWLPLWTGTHIAEAVREGDDLREPIFTVVASVILGAMLAPLRWFLLGLLWIAVMNGVVFFSTVLPRLLRGQRPVVPPRTGRRVRVIFGLLFIAVIFALGASFSDTPWLPAEKIAVPGTANGSVIGYVISSDEEWTRVMRERDRVVVTLPRASVVSRDICTTDAEDQRSLLAHVFGWRRVSYPACTPISTRDPRRSGLVQPTSPPSKP